MHVSRLYIENFRSIEKLDLCFRPGVNIIVGRNNSGKSNIIRALDLVLGEYSPTYAKSENVTLKDFHSVRETIEGRAVNVPATEMFIWCELTREAGEALNYDELYKCIGFYVHARIVEWVKNLKGKSVPRKELVRIKADLLPEHYDAAFSITEDESTEKDYINPKLRHQKSFEDQLDNKFRFAYAFRAFRNGDAITRELRLFYRESDAADWIMAFKASVRNELLLSAIIPSFRDPHAQLRATNWSWYGKLMKALTNDAKSDGELREAFDAVRGVAAKQFSKARDAVNASSLKVAFPDATLHFQYAADTPTELYKNCALYVDDGVHAPLDDKGSGIQSAVVIGLFSYYTHHINCSTSALLCVEEPELYLHPHAQRVIRTRLQDFVSGDDRRHQVIITTHSPEFASARTGGEMLVLVRKVAGKTRAHEIALGDFADVVLDANQSEILFADAVVVCEGFDPYVLRSAADFLMPGAIDEANVSVVAAGGKDRIPRYVALARTLGIPVFVLADFDFLLRDGDTAQAKAHGKTPHKNVFALTEEYFIDESVLGDGGSELFRRLQATIGRLKAEEPQVFWCAKKIVELPAAVQTTITGDLMALRANGVCLLDGEIEGLVREPNILTSGKFTADSVFRFAARLRSGTMCDALLDVEPLRAFVEHAVQTARDHAGAGVKAAQVANEVAEDAPSPPR